MTISKTEFDQLSLSNDAVTQLRSRLYGPLFLPGDAGYDEERAVWNAMIDRHPAAIVRCLGVADVVDCVNFARDHGIPLSIKGGGHNIAGLAMCDHGLTLDMSLMRGIWVDKATQTARAQSGCLLGDMDRETQLYGLAAVLGFVSKTGIAGLTLGGGFGYLTRRFGWSCDNLLSLDLVTADGRIVHCGPDDERELFWALRGGGGNFGVVTSFEYKLHRVGPEIMAGAIAWPASDAGPVLEMYKKITEQAPPELTCVAVLRVAPPVPWLPAKWHGAPIIVWLVCDSGSLVEAHERIAPIKAFRTPIGDIVQPRPYSSQQSLLDATQPKGRRYYWKSEYLDNLAPELLARAFAHAQQMPSPHSSIVIFPVGGALNALSADYSPAGNRTAAYVINIQAAWERPADDQLNIEWSRAAWDDLRPYSTGGTYVNFLTEDEGMERIHAAYGSNYARLVELKTKWDPSNLFRTNKNIAPLTG